MSRNDREADLNTAMALTQRFLGSSDQGLATPAARPSKSVQLGQTLRYWLWRAGGRKRSRLRDTSQIVHLLDNYEIELERLRQAHERDLVAQKQAHDQAITQIQESQRRDLALLRREISDETDATHTQLRQELERERARVHQLEDLAEQFQRVYKQELAKARQAGQDEMHPVLEAAQARVLKAEQAQARAAAEQQEQLASQQAAHEQHLAQCLDEAGRKAETIQAGLRRELQALQATKDAAAEQTAEAMAQIRQDHQAALAQARQHDQDQAQAERTRLTLLLDAAEQERQTALDQARRTHETALAALRTAQAEELAEMRIAGEWALGDAKRQITDLRLRLTEQDENHAEELEELHAQHKQDLALWLSKFEAAQQHQEIRHAGEYAGSTQAKSQALIEAEAALAEQARAVQKIQAEKHREAEEAQHRLSQAQAQAASDLAAAESRFGQISAQFDAARQRLADLEQRLDDAADREYALTDRIKTLTPAQTGLHEAQDRIGTLDRLLSETRQRLAEAEQRLAEAAEQENALVDQITLSEDEAETARARIVALEQHLAQLAEAKAQIETEERLGPQAQTASDVAAAETRFREISAQFDTARQRLADLEQRLDDAADRESALTEQIKTLTLAEAGLYEAQDRAETLDRLLSETRQRLAETEQRLTEAAERENALVDQVTLSEDETATVQARIIALEQHLAQMPSSTAAPDDALALLQAQLTEAQTQLAAERRNVEETVRHLGAVRAELQEWRHKAISPPPDQDTQAHQEELRRQSEEHALTVARLRLDSSRRIAELERLLAQAQGQARTDNAAPQSVVLPPTPAPSDDIDWQAHARATQERARSEAQLAANKIEVLKDALAIAKAARPGADVAAAIDTRFRDVKRAFARAFHPDQGGREHPDKAELFLEFWPVFERIESDDEDDLE